MNTAEEVCVCDTYLWVLSAVTSIAILCAFTPKAHKEENDPGSHSLCIGSQADKEGKEE